VESLKTRERTFEGPQCADSNTWCSPAWRKLGAYREEDCNNDGVLDRICDTHGLDVHNNTKDKRWILLSGDCEAFNLAKGDAPACKEISMIISIASKVAAAKPLDPFKAGFAAEDEALKKGGTPIDAIDAAYKAALSASKAGDRADAESVASQVAAKVAAQVAEGTTITTTTTTSTTTPVPEKCVSVGDSVCADDEVFLPDAVCGGGSLSSCSSKYCCKEKAKCSSSDEKPCSPLQVLVGDAFCGGVDSSSCTGELCCAPKTKCAVASPSICGSHGELDPGSLCAGMNKSSCKAEQCCKTFANCSTVSPSMCGTDAVFAPENTCVDGHCDVDACCLPRMTCLTAEKAVECPPASKFAPQQQCVGADPKSCSTDSCCKPLKTCEKEFDASLCDDPSTVYSPHAFCQGGCMESECCMPKETCSSLKINPCKNSEEFVPDNYCSGSDVMDCDAKDCCAKKSGSAHDLPQSPYLEVS